MEHTKYGIQKNKTKGGPISNTPSVVTHNHGDHNILGSLKRFYPILEQSNKKKILLNKSELINRKRRAPNLKKFVTTAKFTSSKETNRAKKKIRSDHTFQDCVTTVSSSCRSTNTVDQ